MAVCSHCRSRHSWKAKYAVNIAAHIACTRACTNTQRVLNLEGLCYILFKKKCRKRCMIKAVSPTPERWAHGQTWFIKWFNCIWSLHNSNLKWRKWPCGVCVLLGWLVCSVNMVIVSLKNVRNVYNVQKANMWKSVCLWEIKPARRCSTNWEDICVQVMTDCSSKLEMTD